MRYLLPILLVTILHVTASAQLTNGLVAHWSFNGNANDISGNGYNGTPNNITYTTGAQGANNTAAQFNGSSSYIDVAYQSGLNVDSFSICALVKVNDYYTGNCQANSILWRGSQFQNGYYSLLFFDNPFTGSCSIVDTSKNVFAGQISNITGSTSGSQWQYTPTIVSQKWYCVITTFDGNQSKIYVDGTLKSVVNVSNGSIGTSSQGLAIGANRFSSSSAFPYWFNGAIDDLRLYNRPLSATEISQYCGQTFDTSVNIITVAKDTLCIGDSISIQYGITGAFSSNNIFTLQLSDASGSFNNAINLKSLSTNSAGIITHTLPQNIQSGNGYKVRVIASNPVKTSNAVPIIILPTLTPSATISHTPSGAIWPGLLVAFTATATNAGSNPTYQWLLNGQAIQGATLPVWTSHTLSDSDNVCIRITSSYQCTTEPLVEDCEKVQVKTGISSINNVGLKLYPNPTSGRAVLKSKHAIHEPLRLSISNSLGQIVFTELINADGAALYKEINLDALSSGIYIVRMSAGAEYFTTKLTIK